MEGEASDVGAGGEAEAATATEPGTQTVADAVGRTRVGEAEERDAEGKPKPRAAKDASEAAKAKALYKYRRAGAEAEADGDTLARLVGDDWEHEFTGPGGKPRKMTYTDLVRHAQMGVGAQQKMTQAAEEQRRWREAVDFANKSDDDKLAFMVSHLNIEDPDMWILKQADALEQKRSQIIELEKAGRGAEAYELRQKIIEERLARGKRLEEQRAQREQHERQRQEQSRERETKAREAFGKVGLEWGPDIERRANTIADKWAELDIRKTYDEVAAEVAAVVRDERIRELRAILKRDGLKWFPEDLRRELREMELEAVKAAKKEAAAPAKAEVERAAAKPVEESKGVSAREFMRRERGRA
jgi:hypothetical protein